MKTGIRARFYRTEHTVTACIAAAFSAAALGGILLHLATSSAAAGHGWLTAAALAAAASAAASLAGTRRQHDKSSPDQEKMLRDLIFFSAAGRKLGHEAKNFVNNIHMALHGLKNETISKRGEHVVKLLASESARMNAYVRQYRQFFREAAVTKKKKDTEAVLREAIARSQRDNRQASFQAIFSWNPGKALAFIHPGLMEEAFFRLMNTTARLRETGAAVQVHGKIKDGRIIVATTHPGLSAVSPGEMDAFEPFGPTGKISDLFAVRTIAEAHGGDFSVRETPDRKIALEISLPTAGK